MIDSHVHLNRSEFHGELEEVEARRNPPEPVPGKKGPEETPPINEGEDDPGDLDLNSGCDRRGEAALPDAWLEKEQPRAARA